MFGTLNPIIFSLELGKILVTIPVQEVKVNVSRTFFLNKLNRIKKLKQFTCKSIPF